MKERKKFKSLFAGVIVMIILIIVVGVVTNHFDDYEEEVVEFDRIENSVSSENVERQSEEQTEEQTESKEEEFSIEFSFEMERINEVEEILEEHFETIMSRKIESSNPYDYIEESRAVFEEIISFGNEALFYCFRKFSDGLQTDLKGKLMEAVCREIQSIQRPNFVVTDLGYENGQLWYDAFYEEALELVKSYSSSELEKYFPLHDYVVDITHDGGIDDYLDEDRLPDFVYRGNDEILKLVYDTEMTLYGNSMWTTFLIPAITVHGSFVEEHKLRVFATISNDRYYLEADNEMFNVGGSIMPVSITYTKKENGEYELEEYLVSNHGEGLNASIEEFTIYPISGKKIEGLAEEIMEYNSDFTEIHYLKTQNIKEHLKKNLKGYDEFEEMTITKSDGSAVLVIY